MFSSITRTCLFPSCRVMGRRGRGGRNRRERGNNNGPRTESGGGKRGTWSLAQRENAQFEKYYKAQNIVPEGEWDLFMDTLRKDLPTTFRITGCKAEAQELLQKIKGDYFNNLTSIELDDGTKYEGTPKSLEWYPQEMAWQLNMDRKFIRHSGHLEKLHQFLIAETESGFISRQEAVSMIPPLFMDIKPHHKVLDMCAAPGSKTAQMLEMLHADESTAIPEGFIVANDVDFKRCYLLVHQLQRLASPCFAVINHDACRIPSFRITDDEFSKDSIQFDRILADVPCTGDGTMRKNKDVWQKWNPINATNLHGVQKRILRRGAEMLAIGGRIVYSTCSLNPMEDEAVIAHVLQECKGAMELVDVSEELPLLKYQPGISTWKVMSKQEEVFEKVEDIPDRLRTIILPSLFPPDEETAKSLHLERCMRVLPHHQNTGGFFIAVLKKVARMPWLAVPRKARSDEAASKAGGDAGSSAPVNSANGAETDKDSTTGSDAAPSAAIAGSTTETAKETNETSAATESSAQEMTEGAGGETPASITTETGDGDSAADKETPAEVENGEGDAPVKRKADDRGGRPPKKAKYWGNREDPFIYLPADDGMWPAIKEFYGMKEEFPVDQLMIRCGDGKRRHIYFTNKAIKDIVQYNEYRIKFVNLGMKVLSRCDSPYANCDFRLVQDGVSMMNHYVTKRIIDIPLDDIIVLLGQENPFCVKFSQDTMEALESLDQGGCLFRYKPDGKEGHPQCHMALCGWKAKVSTRSFMPKQGRYHYLCLCGHELTSKPHNTGSNARDADNVASESNNGPDGAENSVLGEVLDIRPQPMDEAKTEVKTDSDSVVKIELKEEVKEEVKSESIDAESQQ